MSHRQAAEVLQDPADPGRDEKVGHLSWSVGAEVGLLVCKLQAV